MERGPFIKRKYIITAAILLSLGLCVLFGGTLLRYTRPMEDAIYDLAMTWEGEAEPENWVYDQKGWQVFTSDGELIPDGSGGFYGPVQPEQTFFFSREMTEKLDAPYLRIDTNSYSIAVFLDGELLYSDQPELTEGTGGLHLNSLGWYRDTPVIVRLPESYYGKTLTIAQSSGLSEIQGEGTYKVYPCFVTLYCGYAYESSLIAESFRTVAPATVCFLLSVVLLLTFCVEVYREREAMALLWAAVTLLLWMMNLLSNASFTGKYQGEETLAWILTGHILSMLVVLMFLACCGKKYRWVLWGFMIADGAAGLAALLLEWWYPGQGGNLMSFFKLDLPEHLCLAGLICALYLGYRYWQKESRFYAFFVPIASAGIVVASVWAVLFHGATVFQQLKYVVDGQLAYFTRPLIRICTASAVAATFAEYIEQYMNRRTENRVREERSELTLRSYENLRLHNEQVMMLRHDMVKHLLVLRQMTDEKQRTDYLDELLGQDKEIRPVVQSGNNMLDIIFNSKLSQAISMGVKVEILRCHAPETLPLSDAELCSLVMNLLDNAIEAATAPGVAEPYIRLSMSTKGSFLVLALENAAGKLPKAEATPQRGYGLKIVRQILKSQEDLIQVEQTENSYKVTLAIPLSHA